MKPIDQDSLLKGLDAVPSGGTPARRSPDRRRQRPVQDRAETKENLSDDSLRPIISGLLGFIEQCGEKKDRSVGSLCDLISRLFAVRSQNIWLLRSLSFLIRLIWQENIPDWNSADRSAARKRIIPFLIEASARSGNTSDLAFCLEAPGRDNGVAPGVLYWHAATEHGAVLPESGYEWGEILRGADGIRWSTSKQERQ